MAFIKGYKQTAQQRLKIGLANKGKVRSQAVKDRLSKDRKGKHISPESEFKKGLVPWNKDKRYSKYNNRPYRSYEYRREAYLRGEHGINLSQYEEMSKKQENKCLICKSLNRKLYVDHCHNSNKIRGLLCQQCNSAIGLLNDSIDHLSSAISYLMNHNE